MVVGLVGGVASELWQVLKESRASQAGNSGAAGAAVAPAGSATTDPSRSASASGDPTATNAVSGPAAKVIAGLKSLLIDLQSGSSSGTTGSTAATDASSASSLQSLFSDLGKADGHKGPHHAHHPHGPPPAAGPSSAPNIDGATAAADQASPKPSGGLLEEIARVLKAYGAQAVTGSAPATATPVTA